jgi:hypothetical protein
MRTIMVHKDLKFEVPHIATIIGLFVVQTKTLLVMHQKQS